jgi:hypothetical protein
MRIEPVAWLPVSTVAAGSANASIIGCRRLHGTNRGAERFQTVAHGELVDRQAAEIATCKSVGSSQGSQVRLHNARSAAWNRSE